MNGGAIRAAFDADIRIEDCSFEDNEAQIGGALHVTDATVTVTDSDFTRNSATGGDGGAIWADETILTVSETSLVQNTSLFDGGAVFASECSVTMDTMEAIAENEATYGAGRASIEDAESSPSRTA